MKIEVTFETEIPDESNYQVIQSWVEYLLCIRAGIATEHLEKLGYDLHAERADFLVCR